MPGPETAALSGGCAGPVVGGPIASTHMISIRGAIPLHERAENGARDKARHPMGCSSGGWSWPAGPQSRCITSGGEELRNEHRASMVLGQLACSSGGAALVLHIDRLCFLSRNALPGNGTLCPQPVPNGSPAITMAVLA